MKKKWLYILIVIGCGLISAVASVLSVTAYNRILSSTIKDAGLIFSLVGWIAIIIIAVLGVLYGLIHILNFSNKDGKKK